MGRKRKIEHNEHHLCYQRKSWGDGYAYKIRHAFVRKVPIHIHDELHHDFLEDVPRPSEELCKKAWEEYRANKEEIDSYGVARACAWLYVHIPDVAFRRAMQIQIDFFVLNLGP